MLGRARDVAAAQRDHSQNAVRGRGVPVSSSRLGSGQGRPAGGVGGGQAPVGQVDAGAQDAQSGIGWMPCSAGWSAAAEDTVGFLELAEVEKGGSEREQRLGMAGIGGDPVP